MRTSLLLTVLPTLLCNAASAKLGVPLKWRVQRWEYVVVVQGGEQVGDDETRHTENNIVAIFRGKEQDLPKFEWWLHRNHAKGQYYLMCYHKAPPGTSAWESFDVTKEREAFIILKFHTDHDGPFYATKAKFKDMRMEMFEEFLKQIPFEPDAENTEYHKGGMVKPNRNTDDE